MNKGSTLIFTAPQVCEIVGLEYSKLDYWVRNEIIKPDIAIAEGRGSRRLYSYRNVISLKVAFGLREEGLCSQKLKNIVNYLHENHEQINEHYAKCLDDLVLITDGKEVFQLPMKLESFKEIMTNKEFFWLIPLGLIIKEIDEQIFGTENVLVG